MSKIYGVIPNDPVPDAPAVPVLDEVTAGYVSLSWDAVDRATLYQLYKAGSPIGGPTANLFSTDSAVVPSTAYSYQLQAFNASGGSALSDALAVTTSENSAPEWDLVDQAGVIGQAYSLNLATVCSDVDAHSLSFSVTSGSVPGVSLIGNNLAGTPTTAGANSLTLSASDGYTSSSVTITFTVSDPDVAAPSVPGSVVASVNGSTVTVTWTDSTDATGVATYRVYRGGVLRALSTASPYVESGVPVGTYTYSVSAVDSSANANESAQASATPVSVVAANPDTPISFTATSDGATTINLSWAVGPNGATPDDYDLDFSATSASGPWTPITFVGTATTYQHTGRTAGVTYYYRVRAGLGALESGYAAVSATAPLSDTPDYVDPIALVTLTGGRTTVNVSTTAALNTAITNAVAGTTIQLAAGTYAGAVTVNKTFAAVDALIIKGASNFASIATGTWTMTGARQIVTGVQFSGAGRVIVNGINNHFIGNKISDWTFSKAIICGNSATGVSQCEVAYNEVGPYAGVATSDHWSLKADTSSASNTVPLDVWIHHNYFYGHKASSADNDYSEPGNSGHSWALTLDAGWYWQENLFGVHGDSNKNAVDMKFSGTTFLRNTITATSALKLTARIGGSMIFDGNYLGSNGQILINGPGNIVVANHGTIKVQAGEPGVFTDRPVPHVASSDTLVAKNIGTLDVGNQPNGNYTVAASGTTIEEHTGSINTGLATGTVDHSGQASSYVCTPAVQLTTADVGPSAITNASAAYKAARGL